MTSSKYVVRNLWNKAPVLTTNLVDIGLVDAKFNANLMKAAVTSFDEFVSIRQGGGGKSRSSPPSSSVSAGTRRRQRRTSLSSPSNPGKERPKLPSVNISSDHGNNLTENDFFFEHQKTRGYRLATDAIATCERTERLQEVYLVEIVAYYLKHCCGAGALANLLMLGTGELSIDMWAAVQRGKVGRTSIFNFACYSQNSRFGKVSPKRFSHHKDHRLSDILSFAMLLIILVCV